MGRQLTLGERWRLLTDALPFRIGVIPSEIDPSFEASLDVIRALGFPAVELSEIDGCPLPDLALDQAQWARDRFAEIGVTVEVAGAQTFKPTTLGTIFGDVLDDPNVRADLHELERALQVTSTLGADRLRIYAFRRDDTVGLGNPSPILPDGGPVPDMIVAKSVRVLREAGDLAGVHGVTLAVENVRSCWANTGVNTGRIIRAVDHPRVRVCWDPANDFVAGGDPAGTAYQAVRGMIAVAHLKDARLADRSTGLTAWMPIGKGEVDMAEQIRLLWSDGFDGLASLETHWRAPNGSKAEGSRISFAGLLDAAIATIRRRQEA